MNLAGIRFFLKHFLSHEAGPFAQFVKYGTIGVASTLVQMVVFYTLASTVMMCLGSDDLAVVKLGLPSVAITDSVRAVRFAVNTAIGFTLANIFCWLMDRWFVFRPGKFRWYVEFGMFFGVAACAMLIATLVSGALIKYAGLTSTVAQLIEVVVSFLLNFFVRKFFIFKG